MNLFNNPNVIKLVKILNGQSTCKYLPTDCHCMNNNFPEEVHKNKARPFSSNMAELAARQDPDAINLIIMYISEIYFFNADTMKFLINEMLNCKIVRTIDHYYTVLDRNLRMHPPCADYMTKDYEKLMLMHNQENASKFFVLRGMSLWEYLMECFYRITSGSILCGENHAFDTAFYKLLKFCVNILQMDCEVAKNNGTRPLIMKCLNFDPVKKSKFTEITELLDMLFITGYSFQMPVVQLAILVKEIKLTKSNQ